MKLKNYSILALVLAAIVIIGCGGKTENLVPLAPIPGDTGGDGSGGTTGVTPGTIPPGSSLRRLEPGDMWKYTVTGRMTTIVNGTANASVPITGVLTRTVTEEELGGYTTTKITERLVYAPQGGVQKTRVTEVFIDQDAANAIRVVAKREDGTLFNVTSTDYALIGMWFELATDSGVTNFINDPNFGNADGQSTNTFAVTDQEDVVTPLGKYGTWRAEASQTSSMNYTGVHNRIDLGQFVEAGTVLSSAFDQSTTEWWNPTVGSFIRRVESSTLVKDIFLLAEVTPVGPPQIVKDVVETSLDMTCVLTTTTVR